MSRVVLVSDNAVIGIETVKSKLRVDPVGNIRDLFRLERIFSVFADELFDEVVAELEASRASMKKIEICNAVFMFPGQLCCH